MIQYQIIILCFFVLILFSLLYSVYIKKRTKKEFLFWFTILIILSIMVLLPTIFLDKIRFITGFESGINAIFFISIILLFYINFKLLNMIYNFNEKQSKIIRQETLRDFFQRYE